MGMRNSLKRSLPPLLNLGITDPETILSERNKRWSNNPKIPAWVNFDTMGLDQFFTRPEIAKRCYASLLQTMKADGVAECDYKFIEPAAGTGAFYKLLPESRRIGIDLVPSASDIIYADFLEWAPPKNGKRYVVTGNPPFGYRAWLALAFVNHAALFADYVGFILPMAFQSYGKGSPRFRVNGLKLVNMEYLPQNSFIDISGKPVKINALWQIWKRGENKVKQSATCNKWIDLFTVDMRKERLCGQIRFKEADYFLQRTFFHFPPKLVRDFKDVRYVCGYGLVIKKDKKKVASLLKNTDWKKYSNLAAHNCRHISMYHIRQAVTDAGLVDD